MLKTRVITGVILLITLLGLLALQSRTAVALACTVAFAAAAWETLRLFKAHRPVLGALVWAGVFLYAALFRPAPDAVLLFGLCALIWAIRLAPGLRIGLPQPGAVGDRLVCGIYSISIFGCFFAILALYERSALYLFSTMAIIWIADIGAYFVGKAFGRRKLAPTISPGKSWEGALGGWLCVLAAAVVCVFLVPVVPVLADTFAVHLQARRGWFVLAGILTLIVAASIAGDLFESMLKRRAGVKDSSGLLPGHGGVLDRIDALIPTLPLAVLVDVLL